MSDYRVKIATLAVVATALICGYGVFATVVFCVFVLS